MSDRVHAMVSNAHSDLDLVRGGDWESALGAAGHMGRRDIAELLLAHGARLDLFVAAMLGELAIVEAMLSAHPEMRGAAGPHGIPLLRHAEAGGEQAQAVVDFLNR
jgi:ankyrin repeat protein